MGNIINPVQSPVSAFRLVFFRTITLLSILLTFITSYLPLILQPWKIESVDGRALEFGIWQVCKFTIGEPPMIECYTKYYKNEVEGIGWFQAFRFMMVVSACIQFFVFASVVILTAFKSERFKKPWPIFSYGFLIAGSLTFCSLILFEIYKELEFVEDARIMMDWTEETEIEEKVGFPFYMAWATVGAVWLNSYLCYYTKCIEDAYRRAHDELYNNRADDDDHLESKFVARRTHHGSASGEVNGNTYLLK